MLKFGMLIIFSGFLGIVIGLFASKKLKYLEFERADAQICGTGQIVAAVSVVFVFFTTLEHVNWAWMFLTIGLVAACANWALVVNMTMDTCIPVRRATVR